MPQPTPGDVHIDRVLTDLSVSYTNSAEAQDYISGQVFPVVGVTQKSNKYRTYPRGAWFRTAAQKRAPSTETPGSGWVYSKDTYSCDVWGVHKDIDDQERANADTELALDTDATNFVTGQLLLRRELEWADNYFKAGVWSQDFTGVDDIGDVDATHVLQLDQAASTPIQFFRNLAVANARKTGRRYNTLVIGAEVETTLLNHPQIIERIKYTREGTYELDLLARLIGVQRILVANAVHNTSSESADELDGDNPAADNTDDFEYIFGRHALLCYTAPNPGLLTVSAGYTFSWTGLLGSAAYGGRIKRFRMEPITSDRVEIEGAWDMKVIAPDLGIFFENIIGEES